MHLYGLWQVRFEGVAQPATLLFERHPELSGSVRGGINRDGVRSLVAGDVDEDGDFSLEESHDGQAIAAVWAGAVTEGSCGKEITGSWRSTLDSVSRGFVLRKLPGWQ